MLEQVNDIWSNIDQMADAQPTQQMVRCHPRNGHSDDGWWSMSRSWCTNYIADSDDFFRPIRSYFYWEKHCWSAGRRGRRDTLDGIDVMTEDINNLPPMQL